MKNIEDFKTVLWKVKDLIPAEYNPRKISQKEMDRLKRSITEDGFLEPLLVNTHKNRYGVIIGGHQRLKALTELGVEKVPCVEVEYSLAKEKKVNVQMNKLGGEFDLEILQDEFEMDELEDIGFEQWEFGTGKAKEEIDSFLADSPEGDEDRTPPKISVEHTCPNCKHQFKV